MMSEFLTSQLDYIFFFYGVAFLLLIPICIFLRRRPYRQLAWIWLLWFGVTHGANECLDLLALSLGSGPVFDFARVGLMAISFVFLAEFGRASMVNIRGHGPGRWILVALVGVAALGGLAGLAGLVAASRYALGLVGGLWAAVALLLAARTATLGARSLHTAAIGMAGYALATGLVVNPAPFFPATVINFESFLDVTGVPIQLVRGLMAVLVGTALCFFARASLDAQLDKHLRVWFRNLMRGATAGLTLLLIGGWFLTHFFGDITARKTREDHEHEVKVLQQVVQDTMAGAGQLVNIIAESPAIFPALVSRTPQAIQQANAVLDLYSQAVHGSVCYLMDLHGLTIASSNRHHPDSFVGESYVFRPYFQQALQGAQGRYWALGVTSKEMGYYVSFAVRDKAGKIVGVAVIKKPIVELESVISKNYLGLAIDSHGIVVMANYPDMVLRSLWPLSATAKEEVVASRQFGNGPFTPILTKKPVNGREYLFQGKRQMVLYQPFPWEDWSVVTLSSIWPIFQARLLGISITLLLCLGMIGFLTIIGMTMESAARVTASERLYRTLVEGSPNCVTLFDREGRFLAINESGVKALGLKKDHILERRFNQIWPESSRNRVEQAVQHVLQGQQTSFEAPYLRPDGRTLVWQVALSPVFETGQSVQGFVGIANDITERKRAEEARQEADRERLMVVNNIPAVVFKGYLDGTVDFFDDRIEQMTGYPRVEFDTRRRKFTDLILALDKGPSEQRFLNALETHGSCFVREYRITTQPGEIIWVQERSHIIRNPEGRVDYISGVFFDITARRRGEIALKESLEKVKSALNGTINALAAVVETRDPYTAGHQRNVARLASAIAREMALTEDQIEGINVAGGLHDIGKINVPAEILSKSGRLSEIELQIIKTHPQVGYDILKEIDFPFPVPQAILQHHERLDGSGYPFGLLSQDIILEARVLAVADVMEAMSSHRPYRAALGHDKALDEISRNKGILYDPEVVEVCMRLTNEKGFRFE